MEKIMNVISMVLLVFILVLGVVNFVESRGDRPCACPKPTQTIEKTYVEKAKVIYVSNSTVTVATTDGNEWEFVDKGYCEGDTVEITFSDNSTLTIEDDSVVNVELLGE